MTKENQYWIAGLAGFAVLMLSEAGNFAQPDKLWMGAVAFTIAMALLGNTHVLGVPIRGIGSVLAAMLVCTLPIIHHQPEMIEHWGGILLAAWGTAVIAFAIAAIHEHQSKS